MFSDEDAGRYLFHYTSAEAFLKGVLPARQLKMSRFSNLNDPRESKDWLCSLSVPEDSMDDDWDIARLSADFTAQMKGSAHVLCFTRDDVAFSPYRRAHLYGRGYAHPSMWDRYARNHSGVCLAFDVDLLGDDIAQSVGHAGELLYQGIAYEDMPERDVEAFRLDASEIKVKGLETALREHRREHAGALYFFKSTDWSPEFEFRWVLLAEDPKAEYFVHVQRSFAGVIFGEDFARAAIPMVARELGGSSVTMAQMRYHNGNPVVVPTM